MTLGDKILTPYNILPHYRDLLYTQALNFKQANSILCKVQDTDQITKPFHQIWGHPTADMSFMNSHLPMVKLVKVITEITHAKQPTTLAANAQ